jgi:hypothetical protein
VVGGAGRAFEVPVVAVLKVEAPLGDVGLSDGGEDIVWILAVPGVSSITGSYCGMGFGRRSAWGTGRRRLRIEVAADVADMGSVTTRSF